MSVYVICYMKQISFYGHHCVFLFQFCTSIVYLYGAHSSSASVRAPFAPLLFASSWCHGNGKQLQVGIKPELSKLSSPKFSLNICHEMYMHDMYVTFDEDYQVMFRLHPFNCMYITHVSNQVYNVQWVELLFGCADITSCFIYHILFIINISWPYMA